MATVEQILRASLGDILVQPSESPIEPDVARDFIFRLNAFLTALDADGVALGFTEVDSLFDQVTIPSGALRGLIFNMAIESAPTYGAEVTGSLRALASDGLRQMTRIGTHIGVTAYPSTLPIGSGNEYPGYRSFDRHFYPEVEQDILRETTGAISVELSTRRSIRGQNNV